MKFFITCLSFAFTSHFNLKKCVTLSAGTFHSFNVLAKNCVNACMAFMRSSSMVFIMSLCILSLCSLCLLTRFYLSQKYNQYKFFFYFSAIIYQRLINNGLLHFISMIF